ncbi:ABC transporter permease [Singulisphaera acidiphila]|uniref:ABC-type transport system involved in resistance to organic solvents, permease component n=1 Tax=Singulisphaera acidiphila (strain ATCC BAA-1392 / DSM 18658 / VKM B-2454 / MOB10) TaxID=886293 RepID=L0D9N0_SINAD|nr:ABC transporter permease [Singulisphaera acidiphila]AGA25538.1 ABC-type transport system involved in resistance to organic solvents, permease component [Singulisphaera acidiphila DSM 18658]
MPSPASFLELPLLSPLAMIGRVALGGAAYLGNLGALMISAARSVFAPVGAVPPFVPTLTRQTISILAMGIPLVTLVHIGMGSFLSMQAYFGGTFVDGTGAVVGVGLIRNVAPLMTGLTLAGLLAALYTPELRGRFTQALDADPREIADRDPLPGQRAATSLSPEPARLAAVRLSAGVIAGLVLSVWGVLVGTVVGWQVAQTLLGVSTDSFFAMFLETLWIRDVAGLVIKGGAFALFAALFACHEGLSGSADTPSGPVSWAACRAACFATVATLALNSIWFLLVYHAGPAFGPTLLAPPGL